MSEQKFREFLGLIGGGILAVGVGAEPWVCLPAMVTGWAVAAYILKANEETFEEIDE